MDFRFVGLKLKSGVVGSNGGIEIALLVEGIAQVVVSVWVVGVELKSGVVGGNSSIEFALLLEGITPVVVG